MRLIAKRYSVGDIPFREEAIEEMREFTEDFFKSYPRQKQDTSDWDWGLLLDQYLQEFEEDMRWNEVILFSLPQVTGNVGA